MLLVILLHTPIQIYGEFAAPEDSTRMTLRKLLNDICVTIINSSFNGFVIKMHLVAN